MLSVAEIAKRLGVSEPSVRRWCATGRLPAITAGPGGWRVSPADLADFIEASTRRRLPRYTEPEFAVLRDPR